MGGNCYKCCGIWSLLFQGNREIKRDDGGDGALMILRVGVRGLLI